MINDGCKSINSAALHGRFFVLVDSNPDNKFLISLYLVEMKSNNIILFEKYTETKGYQTRIKVRHEIKIMKF
jgi:hypothetical protein